jgi:hypothetical protein
MTPQIPWSVGLHCSTENRDCRQARAGRASGLQRFLRSTRRRCAVTPRLDANQLPDAFADAVATSDVDDPGWRARVADLLRTLADETVTLRSGGQTQG